MTRRFDLPQILLLLAAFLLPIMGGQVVLEAGSLPNGLSASLGTLFGGPDAPTLSHALLALLAGGAFAVLMVTRRVVQVPNNTLGVALVIFCGGVALSTILSAFKSFSMPLGIEWVTYAIAFFAVVGSIGRRKGPVALVACLVAGCTVVALMGFMEYGDWKAIDPTWRIFPLWNNPNALAVMLLIGFVLSLGLVLTQERMGALLAGLSSVLIGVAILLTQSKGVVLLVPFGVLGVVISALMRVPRVPVKRTLGSLIAVLAFIGLFAFAIQKQAAAATSGASFSHLATASSTSEQSAGFRTMLWKTSLALIKADPAGSGVGTFRYVSGKPGIATPTVLAHNAYLQLATEGSVLLPAVLLVVVLLWLRLLFRGLATLPVDTRVLLGSVATAVLVVLGHSLIDSDLYYFGVGLAVFMLMGLGLLLSTDSVAPEFLFPAIRRLGGGIACLTLVMLLYFGYTESLRSEARGAMQAGNRDAALSALDTLHSIAPTDGEAWFMTAQTSSDVESALEPAKKAVRFAPSARNLRFLARLELQSNQLPAALGSVQRALTLDPKGLNNLSLLAEVKQKLGDTDGYRTALEDLVAVEKTPYFQVRSLPELVPTETYEARVSLVELTNDTAKRRALLKEAVEGFKQYQKSTLPNVLRMAKAEPPTSYGGEDLPKAQKKMAIAADAAQRLATLDRAAGDAAGAAEAEADAAGFLGAVK